MNINRAIVAGIIGGVIVDLYLIVTRTVPFPGVYQFIASTLVGPVAFTSSSYIALGLTLHFVIAIVAALVYFFAAQRSAALVEHPLVWGAVFGVGVMIVMQLVTAGAHAGQSPTLVGVLKGLVTHVVFFGIPVAWYLTRGAAAGRRSIAA